MGMKKQENKPRQDKRLCLQVEETFLAIVETWPEGWLIARARGGAGLMGKADDEVS